jgi:outer membrane biosynthesis protein TonB
MDAVTEILLERSQKVDNLTRMVLVSLAAHAAIVTAVTLLPRQWATPRDTAPVMTISLNGAPGEKQGRNTISAKEIQQAVPETVKPKNDAPPALTKPEMVEPVKAAKPEPKPPAKPEPKKEVVQLHGAKPTQGAEVKAGTAKIETHGAAIPFGGGLATGGGGAGQPYTDVANFCCPEYLSAVADLIRKNWNSKQGQDGSSVIMFVIQRDGTIADVKAEQGSNQLLNLAAQRAVVMTQRVPPLPAAFTPPQLTLHLVFQYQR